MEEIKTRREKQKKRGLLERMLNLKTPDEPRKEGKEENEKEEVEKEEPKEENVEEVPTAETEKEELQERIKLSVETKTEDILGMSHLKQLTQQIKTTLAKDRIRIGYPPPDKWGVDSIELYDELIHKEQPSLVISSQAIMGYNGRSYSKLYERPTGGEYDAILSYDPDYDEINSYGGLIGYTRYIKPLMIRALDMERNEREREAHDRKVDEVEQQEKALRQRKRAIAEEELSLERYHKELEIKRETLEQEAEEIQRYEEDLAKKAEALREDVEAYNSYVNDLHDQYEQYEKEKQEIEEKQKATPRYSENYIQELEERVAHYEAEGEGYREEIGTYLIESQKELLDSYSTYFLENLVAMIEHYGIETDIQSAIIETQHEYLNQMLAKLPEEQESTPIVQAYQDLQQVEHISKEEGIQIVKETLAYIKQGEMYAGYEAGKAKQELEKVMKNLIEAKDNREIEKNQERYEAGEIGREELEQFDKLVSTLRKREEQSPYSVIHLNGQAMSIVLSYNFHYRLPKEEEKRTERVYYYITLENIMDIRIGKSYITQEQGDNLYPYPIAPKNIEQSQQIGLEQLIELVKSYQVTKAVKVREIREVSEEADYLKRYERIKRIYNEENIGMLMSGYGIEIRYGKGQAKNVEKCTRERLMGSYIGYIGKKGALILYSNRYHILKRGEEDNMVWGKYTTKVELIEELGNHMKYLQYIFGISPKEINQVIRPYMTGYDLRTRGVV